MTIDMAIAETARETVRSAIAYRMLVIKSDYTWEALATSIAAHTNSVLNAFPLLTQLDITFIDSLGKWSELDLKHALVELIDAADFQNLDAAGLQLNFRIGEGKGVFRGVDITLKD